MKLLLAAVAVLVVLAAAGVVVFVQRGSDAPAPPELSAPPEETERPAQDGEQGDGTWEATGGFLGYRVRETLAGIGATTAVGRTRAISGRVTVRDGQAVRGRIGADLRELTSDEPRRDNRIRSDGLESDAFPRATFVLTRPAALGRAAMARGRLTLHGVTRPIAMPIRSQLTGGRLEIVGTERITFAQFDMRPPSIAGFVSVRPDARIEVRLVLEPA